MLENASDMATTLIGTPYYMSPELFSNKPYSYKVQLSNQNNWGFFIKSDQCMVMIRSLSLFSTRRICSRKQRKKLLDWLATVINFVSI